MVERIGDDRVLLAEQGFEQAAVGVEAGGVEDRVLGAEERRDLLLKLLVQVLGAADETHRGHAEAVTVERILGRLDHRRVIGQSQVIVRAKVQHATAVSQFDFRRLRAGDDAFGLEQSVGADGIKRGAEAGKGLVAHGGAQFQLQTTLPQLPASIRSKPFWKSSMCT